MNPTQKPIALLRLMIGREGVRITARDVAALRLAIATMEAQEKQQENHMRIYRETLYDLVEHESRAAALLDGMRALLEVHT